MTTLILIWLALLTVGLSIVISKGRRLMTLDADLTTVEGRFNAAVGSIKTEIASLTAALAAAAGGDGLTADQAAAHLATLQGLATQLEGLETPAAQQAGGGM